MEAGSTMKATKRLRFFVVFLTGFVAFSQGFRKKGWKCEKITSSLCDEFGYNRTRMPNILGHDSQGEAEQELLQFLPLIRYQCASQLQFFLCSAYFPMCTEKVDVMITSCRPLCEFVRMKCLPVLSEFGIAWPVNLNCSKFLKENNLKAMCMSGPNITDNPTTNVVSLNESTTITATPAGRRHTGSEQCRKFKNSVNYYYVGSTESCAVLCNEEGIFKTSDKNAVDTWMTLWSTLCFLCTSAVLCTFFVDTKRFKYPERSIIWLALCCNLHSISFIVRLAAGREYISCDQESNGPKFLIQDGLRNTGCAIVFLVQYFFSMAATVWWVILALSWFLAAAMKWGHGEIGSYSNLFHVISWTLPGIKTIFILITRKIDGDELTGLCFVGNQDLIALAAFVLGPEFTYLIIGTLFLIAGFVSLFRCRSTVQRNGTKKSETSKLERLIVRLGIFSVFSTVPATAVIACYFYEYANKEYWFYGKRHDKIAEPNLGIFQLKIFMSLFVGTISGLWICSLKTVQAWKKFYYVVTGKRPRRPHVQKNGHNKNTNETTV
ncbi:frizzled-4-like [Montipora capricornis]|uniref:frizzled-4-like n=1 Tax=Montipora capricornis TaxID=246305 RepID=UPI0035F1327E